MTFGVGITLSVLSACLSGLYKTLFRVYQRKKDKLPSTTGFWWYVALLGMVASFSISTVTLGMLPASIWNAFAGFPIICGILWSKSLLDDVYITKMQYVGIFGIVLATTGVIFTGPREDEDKDVLVLFREKLTDPAALILIVIILIMQVICFMILMSKRVSYALKSTVGALFATMFAGYGVVLIKIAIAVLSPLLKGEKVYTGLATPIILVIWFVFFGPATMYAGIWVWQNLMPEIAIPTYGASFAVFPTVAAMMWLDEKPQMPILFYIMFISNVIFIALLNIFKDEGRSTETAEGTSTGSIDLYEFGNTQVEPMETTVVE